MIGIKITWFEFGRKIWYLKFWSDEEELSAYIKDPKSPEYLDWYMQ